MKIINFYFGNNCNIIFIFFAVLLIIYSIKYFYESCSFCLWEKLHDLPFQEQLKFDFFVTLVTILCCLFSISFMLKNSKNTLFVEYINENADKNEINISKEQIINDILSGKITQNKNNLQVYSQEIPITEEEYEKLNKYKEEYDKRIENGNVYIIN